MGRSLGSGVATYIAANRKIDRLILVTPFDSIENVANQIYRIFPVILLLKDKFRSLDRVKDIKAESLILVAENDSVIPRLRTDKLITLFDKEKLTTIVIQHASHNDISDHPEFAQGIRRFLD